MKQLPVIEVTDIAALIRQALKDRNVEPAAHDFVKHNYGEAVALAALMMKDPDYQPPALPNHKGCPSC